MDSRKRKADEDLNKIIKIIKCFKIYKRKSCIDVQCKQKSKKQKTCKCIYHEEKYICDIYECNGKINRDNFIDSKSHSIF